jgi:hypothetical protein
MTARKAKLTFEAALAGLNKDLPGGKGGKSIAASKADPCDTYRRIKPYLQAILPFVEKVPMWGKRIADAIRLLMKIADAACPM